MRITRTLKIHEYKFGVVNSDNTVSVFDVIETAEPMRKKAMDKYCRENNVILLSHTEDERLVGMPIDLFYKTCLEYAVKEYADDDTNN